MGAALSGPIVRSLQTFGFGPESTTPLPTGVPMPTTKAPTTTQTPWTPPTVPPVVMPPMPTMPPMVPATLPPPPAAPAAPPAAPPAPTPAMPTEKPSGPPAPLAGPVTADRFVKGDGAEGLWFEDFETGTKHLVRVGCDMCSDTAACEHPFLVPASYLNGLTVGRDFECEMMAGADVGQGMLHGSAGGTASRLSNSSSLRASPAADQGGGGIPWLVILVAAGLFALVVLVGFMVISGRRKAKPGAKGGGKTAKKTTFEEPPSDKMPLLASGQAATPQMAPTMHSLPGSAASEDLRLPGTLKAIGTLPTPMEAHEQQHQQQSFQQDPYSYPYGAQLPQTMPGDPAMQQQLQQQMQQRAQLPPTRCLQQHAAAQLPATTTAMESMAMPRSYAVVQTPQQQQFQAAPTVPLSAGMIPGSYMGLQGGSG
mmetsp:Transcript_1635/g.4516  ORF Transcript_1635/g.4516 Transcript_1635/m.4516 type:complete len:425 (-) Transcript_1635:135-1409(-)